MNSSKDENEVIQPEEMPTNSVERPNKKKLDEIIEKLKISRKNVKILQQTKRRYKRKIENLEQLLSELKEKRYLNEDEAQVLNCTTGHTKEIFDRLIAKGKNVPHPKKFSRELRAFALTLHYYSVNAYKYVRKSFNLCLPHPRTISKWYQHVNGEPGFTAESFVAVANKIKEAKHELLFSLTFDEMAIRQQVDFDGKKFHGYINMGIDANNDVLPVAKASLLFLLTAVNDTWKIPLGYFLIDTVSSTQKANLVKQCLILLHDINAHVICITFDGLTSNITMAKLLGCNMDPEALHPRFPHPVTNVPISIYLDPSHMLKLVRNCLGEKKSVVDSENNLVNWKFITELHNLQDAEGLHLGNKLRSSHINYFTRKMKVSLAAQVLSKSVADSLQICNDNDVPGFDGCEATVKFIRIFNDLFDILNSQHNNFEGWKGAASKDTYVEIKNKLCDIKK